MNTVLKILQHVVTRPHREGDDRHGSGLVGAIRKNARVADVEIRNIVRLRPLVRD